MSNTRGLNDTGVWLSAGPSVGGPGGTGRGGLASIMGLTYKRWLWNPWYFRFFPKGCHYSICDKQPSIAYKKAKMTNILWFIWFIVRAATYDYDYWMMWQLFSLWAACQGNDKKKWPSLYPNTRLNLQMCCPIDSPKPKDIQFIIRH